MNENNLFIKMEQYDEITKILQDVKQRATDVRRKMEDLNKIDDIEKRKIKECQELLTRIDMFTDKTEQLLKKR